MAARFWRSLIGGNLAIAALIAAVCLIAWSWRAAAVGLVGGFLGVPWLVLTSSFIYASVSGGAAASRPRPLDGLRAWLIEPIQFSRAILAMTTLPGRRPLDMEPPAGEPDRPVLLIHGIACNRGVWQGWTEPLRAAGFAPVRAIDLEPIFADIDGHAAQVAETIRAMQVRSGGAPVAIIAHSMGGLIARAALEAAGPGVVGRIVTIASPHHGTRWAGLLPLRVTRQMRPDSSWLQALNARQEGHWDAALTSIYSMQDEFIVPARSAVLAGAQLHEMHGVGHLGILGSSACMKLAIDALGHA